VSAEAVAGAWFGRLRGRLSAGVLDHVAVAVPDERGVLAFFSEVMALAAGPAEEVPSQRVFVRFLSLGDAAIELVVPTSDDSPVAKFLASRGPGLHHVALRVDL
jgi:methylmalonyl-CoA/ethylmalonyl-CoA epimerase